MFGGWAQQDDGTVTEVDGRSDDRLAELLVDPDALPTVYTGQLVDIDVDGAPDVALFGSTEAPIVRAVVEPKTRDWTVLVGLAAALAVLGASVMGPIASVWAKSRRGTDDKDEEDDDDK
jgi:hypothetical protein